MGFVDLLFGSKKPTNVEIAPERIWMTNDAKFAGLDVIVGERHPLPSVGTFSDNWE